MFLYSLAMHHRTAANCRHGIYFISAEQYLDTTYLWGSSFGNYEYISFRRSKECTLKWRMKCGIWIHSCSLQSGSGGFSFQFPLQSFVDRSLKRYIWIFENILLFSGCLNDCNQSDFLCSGRTMKLQYESFFPCNFSYPVGNKWQIHSVPLWQEYDVIFG